MTTVKLCGIAIVTVMAIVTFRQLRPEFASALNIAACIILFMSALACFTPVTQYISEVLLQDTSGALSAFSPYIKIIMKSLGVGMITQTSADICRDAGEASVASRIEFAGKAEIMVLSLPLLSELFALTRGLLI